MPDTTPAQELRQAAALMRERATAATEGPWSVKWIPPRYSGFDSLPEVYMVVVDGRNVASASQCDAEYVAGMHPGVALAVADLLDKIAWMGELDPEMLGRVGCDEAIEIARAYLGTKTPERVER